MQNQRIVKPAFWPVLVVSSIFLSFMMYFLIGGILTNRMEDVFISAMVGVILFIAARTVKNNVAETPTLAVAMMFFWPAIAVLSLILMNSALSNVYGNVGQVFSYANQMLEIRATGMPIPGDLQSMFLLSAGIISAIVFIVAQVLAIVLLFVGTMPEKKDFRH